MPSKMTKLIKLLHQEELKYIGKTKLIKLITANNSYWKNLKGET